MQPSEARWQHLVLRDHDPVSQGLTLARLGLGHGCGREVACPLNALVSWVSQGVPSKAKSDLYRAQALRKAISALHRPGRAKSALYRGRKGQKIVTTRIAFVLREDRFLGATAASDPRQQIFVVGAQGPGRKPGASLYT